MIQASTPRLKRTDGRQAETTFWLRHANSEESSWNVHNCSLLANYSAVHVSSVIVGWIVFVPPKPGSITAPLNQPTAARIREIIESEQFWTFTHWGKPYRANCL